MFHRARLTATTLVVCASLGLVTQAKAGLSLADPEASEALARSNEVCTPVKSATPVRQKLKHSRVAIVNHPRAHLQFPLLLGVAY